MFAEFFAEAFHVSVERASEHGVGVAPDLAEESVAFLDLAVGFDEESEEFEFGGGEVDGLACEEEFEGIAFEEEVAGFEAGVDGDLAGAFEESADAEEEFAWAEGLGDVVVGAEFEACDAVVDLAFGGEHEDGDAVSAGVGAEFAEDAEAVHAWEHEVEDDEVGDFVFGDLDGGDAVVCCEDLELLAFEVKDHQFENVRLVIDH